MHTHTHTPRRTHAHFKTLQKSQTVCPPRGVEESHVCVPAGTDSVGRQLLKLLLMQ